MNPLPSYSEILSTIAREATEQPFEHLIYQVNQKLQASANSCYDDKRQQVQCELWVDSWSKFHREEMKQKLISAGYVVTQFDNTIRFEANVQLQTMVDTLPYDLSNESDIVPAHQLRALSYFSRVMNGLSKDIMRYARSGLDFYPNLGGLSAEEAADALKQIKDTYSVTNNGYILLSQCSAWSQNV